MDKWQLVFTKQGEKDARKIASCGLGKQVNKLLDVIQKNPYQSYPPYEKLTGDLFTRLLFEKNKCSTPLSISNIRKGKNYQNN